MVARSGFVEGRNRRGWKAKVAPQSQLLEIRDRVELCMKWGGDEPNVTAQTWNEVVALRSVG